MEDSLVKKFQEALVASNKVLILLPKDPDVDSVASGLALYLSLSKYGKQVAIACLSPMLVEFNELVGVDRVTTELGNKNLVITISDYPAVNIERVSYNIENGQFRLVVIPKPGYNSPDASQVAAISTGLGAETVLLVGVTDEEQLGDEVARAELYKSARAIFVIGRAIPNPNLTRRPGVSEVVDPSASSVSEVLAFLITNGNLPLDEDSATNLLRGITAATRNFTNRVRPETFELVARLMRMRNSTPQAASEGQANVEQEDEKPPEDWLAPKVYKGSTLP